MVIWYKRTDKDSNILYRLTIMTKATKFGKQTVQGSGCIRDDSAFKLYVRYNREYRPVTVDMVKAS